VVFLPHILNQNLNADLWRGQRYFVRKPKPTNANIGDLAFDGTTLWVWNGLTWTSLAGGGLSAIQFLANGGLIGSQPGLNLIQGSNVTITGVNNPGQSRVDVTVTASAGGGTPHPLLDGVQNNDTSAYTPTSGDLIVSSGNKWTGLPKSLNNYVLTLIAGIPSWQPAGAATTPSLLRNMIAVGS
jgi:hypothetical protein